MFIFIFSIIFIAVFFFAATMIILSIVSAKGNNSNGKISKILSSLNTNDDMHMRMHNQAMQMHTQAHNDAVNMFNQHVNMTNMNNFMNHTF